MSIMRSYKNRCTLWETKFAYNYVLLNCDKIKSICATFGIPNKFPNKKFRHIQSANNQAEVFLASKKVQDLIANLEERIHGTKEEVSEKAKQILSEWDLIAFFDPREMFDVGTEERMLLDKLGDKAKAISRIKITLKKDDEKEIDIFIHDKTKALTKYGEHFKLYTQVMEHAVDIVHPAIWGMPDNGTRKNVDE